MILHVKHKKIILFTIITVILFLAVSQSGLAARISLPALVFDKIRAFLSDEHTSLSAADYQAGTIILIKPIATGVGEGRYEAGDIVEIRDGEELYNKFGHGSFLGAEEKSKLVPFYLNQKLTAEQKEELMAPVSDNSVILRPQAEESHGASSENEILRSAQDDQGTSNENPQPPLLKGDEGRLDSKMNRNKGMVKRRQYGIDYTLILSDQDILAIRQEQPLDKIPEVKFEQIMNKEKKLSYFVIARSMATKQSSNVNDALKIAALPSVTRNDNQKKPGSDSVVCLPKHLAITENIINITKQIKNQLIPTAYAVPTETVKVVDPGNGSGTDYLSLNAWEAAQEQDLVTNDAIAVAKCRATNATPDTTAVTISGWTTSSTTYIKIWTDPTEGYRHNGKWDEGKYRLELATNVYGISVRESSVIIDGVQIRNLASADTADSFASETRLPSDDSSPNITFSNNIFRGTISTTTTYWHQAYTDWFSVSTTSGVVKFFNNISYGYSGPHTVGIEMKNFTYYVYNNTIFNSSIGLKRAGGSFVAKNNISYNNTDNYNGTFDAASTNNLSGPTQTDAPGSNPKNGVKVNFVSTASTTAPDLHLSPADTAAKNAGADLSADANLAITTDIDNETRSASGGWDIGADEVKTSVVINSERPLPQNLDSDLVGYWSFDGPDMDWSSSTGEVLDRSGNNRNANAIGIDSKTAVKPGISGQALNFRGQDAFADIITATSSTAFDFGDLTFSAWVKADTLSNWDCIMTTDQASNYFGLYNGQYSIWTRCGSIYTGHYMTKNQWHFVVWSIEGENYYLYEDGQLLHSGDGCALSSNCSTFNIGARGQYGSTMGFDGLIDEVRVYNRALSASEVKDLYDAGAAKMKINTPAATPVGLTSGLVGYWSFNGPDMDWRTNIAYDRSGQGNNGTMISMSTTTSPAAGIAGQALKFDGVNDYVDAGDINALDGISQMTLSAWFYRTSADNLALIAKGPSSLNKLGININTSIYFNISDGENSAGYTTCNNTGWFHAAMVFDGNQTGNANRLKGYINGQGKSLNWWGGYDIPAITDSNSSNFLIGKSEAYNNFSIGKIDEVRVYNRALSADEVLELYNLGAQRKMVPNQPTR